MSETEALEQTSNPDLAENGIDLNRSKVLKGFCMFKPKTKNL